MSVFKISDPSLTRGPVWEIEVRQKVYSWLARSKTWICSATSLHIVYFENLVENMKEETDAMLKFLNFQASDDRIHCAINYGVRYNYLRYSNIDTTNFNIVNFVI